MWDGVPQRGTVSVTNEIPVYPSLSFLSLFFRKKAGKTTKKTRIFYPYRTPKIPGKEGKNARKNKEILARRKNKEIPKNKERKDRAGTNWDPSLGQTGRFCLLRSSKLFRIGFSYFFLKIIYRNFFFQDWAGEGIFTVIPGNPWRTKGDSQHLEARPELQDWLRSELFTVKNYRTGPFPK